MSVSSVVPPGEKLRFRVHDDALGDGSSWAVTTSAKAADIVVSHREGAKWLHATFHASGEWHYAITAEAAEVVPDAPRHFGIVRNHEPLAFGWTRALAITVPHSELRTNYKEAAKGRRVLPIPINTSADATDVYVLLGEQNAARIRVDNAFHVGEMALSDGGQVVVVASPVTLSLPVHDALRSQIAEAKAGLKDRGWGGMTPTRIVINGLSADGYLQQFEIAIDPET